MYTHLCDYKRRWQERGQTANRIGYNAWVSFYKKSNLKKNISYMDFAKSRYYTAFVKFGHYCSDIKAINTSRYVDWLFDNNIKLHEWCSDVNYNKFLIQYLKDEDPFDAVARSVETMIDHAKEIEIQGKDCFRYANKNRIVQMIVNGKISPWILYNCESGIAFLESLDEVQQKYIYDYINPEYWLIKLKRDRGIMNEIKQILKVGGY